MKKPMPTAAKPSQMREESLGIVMQMPAAGVREMLESLCGLLAFYIETPVTSPPITPEKVTAMVSAKPPGCRETR